MKLIWRTENFSVETEVDGRWVWKISEERVPTACQMPPQLPLEEKPSCSTFHLSLVGE
jgi:hypothetical protein